MSNIIKTNHKFNNESISYEVLDNGYNIYLGDILWITQHEPYIPYKELSYEASALKQIEDIVSTDDSDVPNVSLEDRILELERQLEEEKQRSNNNYDSITLCEEALAEIYEMIIGE